MEEPLHPGQRRVGRRLFLAMIAGGAGVLAGGAHLMEGLGNIPLLRGFIPSDGFYFYTVSTVEPSFDGHHWDLRVEGMVDRPLTISYADLVALDQSTQVHDYHCVTGWSVKSVRWTGPLVSTILGMAGVKAGATSVSFDSADGVYVDSLTLAEAMRPEVQLAHHINGKPMPADRGGPLRLVIPFMYGYKGTKWVSRIRVTGHQEIGYWEQRGYDVDAYLT